MRMTFRYMLRRHAKNEYPVPYVKLFFEEEGKDDRSKVKEKEMEMEMKARKLKDEHRKQRKPLPITEVVVGPVEYQKEAKAACEILLADRGYKNVKVSVSNIPYRGL